jgi:hypothetical protein
MEGFDDARTTDVDRAPHPATQARSNPVAAAVAAAARHLLTPLL